MSGQFCRRAKVSPPNNWTEKVKLLHLISFVILFAMSSIIAQESVIGALLPAAVHTVRGKLVEVLVPPEPVGLAPNWSTTANVAGINTVRETASKATADTIYHFYFGNLHSHTSYSDGVGTPADAFRHARDVAGIDFLAVTDHHNYLTPDEYADILLQADAYTQDGIFVAIGGQEWTGSDPISGVMNHINIFEADHIFTAPGGNLDSLYRELLKSGCTANFNHPSNYSFNNFTYSLIGDSGVNSVEVRNDWEHSKLIQILNNGWKVGVDGSQDNHDSSWGDGSSWSGPCWTVALASILTKEDILDAMRNHRTYSTGDRNLQLTFQAEGHWMGESFTHGSNIHFSIGVNDPDVGDRTDYIALYQNDLIIDRITIDSNMYNWYPEISPLYGENYYFVKIHQADGENIWSSPIWIDCPTCSTVVGYWKFNEGSGSVAYDASGLGNNGTLMNGPVWVDGLPFWVDGLPLLGKALKYDGVDDYVVVLDTPSLDLTNALTISMWFKPDSNIYPGFPDYYHLIGKWHDEQGNPEEKTGYFMSLNTYGTGQLRLGLGFGSDQWNFLSSGKGTWDGGQWYCVVATYDRFLPSGNVKLYVNGLLDSQYDESRVIAINTFPLCINIDPLELLHPGNTYFPGLIDEVKVYNYALSTEEIHKEFEKGFARGDVNADAILNIVDVIRLATYVLKGGYPPTPLQSGEVNCDGKYDIVDVVKLAHYILWGYPLPC